MRTTLVLCAALSYLGPSCSDDASGPAQPDGAGAGADAGAAPVDGASSPIDPTATGMHDYTLTTADGERHFTLHLPASYDPARVYPLLFLLHGGDGGGSGSMTPSGADMLVNTGYGAKAEAEGFIAIAPRALGGNWNDGRPDTDAALAGIDDVAFFDAMITAARSSLHVDPARVFATGMSNGAMMSHRLGCERAGVFAAIAPVSGQIPRVWLDCAPTAPVSVFEIQGAIDPLNQVGGRDHVASSVQTATHWATFNGCTDAAAIATIATRSDAVGPEVETYLARGCTGGARVDFHIIKGMGHAWPPNPSIAPAIGGPTSDAIDATDASWAFFAGV